MYHTRRPEYNMLTHITPYKISMSLTILCASNKYFFLYESIPSLTAKAYLKAFFLIQNIIVTYSAAISTSFLRRATPII